MLIPKKDRKAIYTLLFSEGVLVAKKDIHLPKHPQLDVPNLHVVKAMTGLKSRGFVQEQFCWRHYYWYLTNEGIQHLREYLHLPPEIVPATLKRQVQARQGEMARPLGSGAPKSGEAVPLDRAGYRRDDKAAAAGAGAAPIGFSFDNRGSSGYHGSTIDVYANPAHPATLNSSRSTSVHGLHYSDPRISNIQQQQNSTYVQASGLPSAQPKNAPLMRGWLFNWEGWAIKSWHKRWAVLRFGTLNLYKSSTSDKLLNSFLLHNYQITISGRDDKNYRRHAFRCEAPGLKTLYFATETELDMTNWVNALQNAVKPNGNNYDRMSQVDQPRPMSHADIEPQRIPNQIASPQSLNLLPVAQPYQTNYYGYKQSPPLPPPVRFPPPQPLQNFQAQPYNNTSEFPLTTNYENQQPIYETDRNFSSNQTRVKPDLSASRQRFGAFIQQLDAERRQRSASMVGLSREDPTPQYQQPLPLQNQQMNSLPHQGATGYGQNNYENYSQVPTTSSSQPLSHPTKSVDPAQDVAIVEPPIIPQTTNRYSAPFLFNSLQMQIREEQQRKKNQWENGANNYDTIESVTHNGGHTVVNVGPQKSRNTAEAYSSPLINREKHDSEKVQSQCLGAGNSSHLNKIPNLQDRVYSLMRSVNGPATGVPNNPSLSHWLSRDIATSTPTVNDINKPDEDRNSGTITPTLKPEYITRPQQLTKRPQTSPQYSHLTKKVGPASQSSSIYVEHWLDAHTSEASQAGNAGDGESSSSPEPPRRVEDIFGKTRDELVLMLIQLRRRQAQGRYVDPTLYQIIEQQLGAERSVINLVDNVVAPNRYSDSNTLKRQRNDERLNAERVAVAEQLKQANEVDYDSKQAVFWRIDEAVSRQTEVVTSLQEQHQQLLDAINVIRSRMTSNASQIHQLTQLESSLQGIRGSLATASRHLESLIFQRNQLEKELQELKAKQVSATNQLNSRSLSVPSLQNQRYYPQPVVPVAPILQQQKRAEAHSPVYATVRRFQNTSRTVSVTEQNSKTAESTPSTERAFSYHSGSQKAREFELPFKKPEPIYSKPIRFVPHQAIPETKADNYASQPIHHANSMTMLSDAGSEATIDSLARQYTGPENISRPESVSNVNALTRSGNENDYELVDMVQRAIKVVESPHSKADEKIIQKVQQRHSDSPLIYTTSSSSVPRRFSAHLRVPTPPPAGSPNRRDSSEFEVEAESFERDVFGAPDKIEIPERYDPRADIDTDSDNNKYDEAVNEQREQRSERYRQMLLKQSLSNLTSEEAANMAAKSDDLQVAIKQESQERHRLLRLSQSLAQQVKSVSIHQADKLRRSMPSGLHNSHYLDLPPASPPPPPPQEAPSSHRPYSRQSPETLWMEFGNHEMAVDVC